VRKVRKFPKWCEIVLICNGICTDFGMASANYGHFSALGTQVASALLPDAEALRLRQNTRSRRCGSSTVRSGRHIVRRTVAAD
jgi:hypothetical protein